MDDVRQIGTELDNEADNEGTSNTGSPSGIRSPRSPRPIELQGARLSIFGPPIASRRRPGSAASTSHATGEDEEVESEEEDPMSRRIPKRARRTLQVSGSSQATSPLGSLASPLADSAATGSRGGDGANPTTRSRTRSSDNLRDTKSPGSTTRSRSRAESLANAPPSQRTRSRAGTAASSSTGSQASSYTVWTDAQGRNWMRHPDGSTRCIVDSLTLVYHQPRKRHTGEYFEMRDGESDMLYRVFLYEGSNRWGYPQNARMHYYPLFTNDGRRIPEKNLVRSKRVGPKEKRALSAGPTKACTRSLLPGQVKRTKKKRKAATNAIREIRKYQGKHFREVEREIDRHGNIKTVTKDRYTMEEHATELLIKKAPFQRLVREIAIDFKSDLRMTDKALEALQVAAEAHLLSVFQDANLCALNSLRETVKVRDMRLASKIRRDARPDDLRDWMDKNPGCFVSMSMFKKDGAEDGLYVRKQRREIGCAIPRFDGVPDLYW